MFHFSHPSLSLCFLCVHYVFTCSLFSDSTVHPNPILLFFTYVLSFLSCILLHTIQTLVYISLILVPRYLRTNITCVSPRTFQSSSEHPDSDSALAIFVFPPCLWSSWHTFLCSQSIADCWACFLTPLSICSDSSITLCNTRNVLNPGYTPQEDSRLSGRGRLLHSVEDAGRKLPEMGVSLMRRRPPWKGG